MKGIIIPEYLPDIYRECADEDGVMQRYRIPVDVDSFRLGYKMGIGESARQIFTKHGWGRPDEMAQLPKYPHLNSHDEAQRILAQQDMLKARWHKDREEK